MSEALSPLIRGTSFGFLAKRGYFRSPQGMAQPARMASIGVNWVALNITVMQPNAFSTRMYQDYEYTPDDREIEDIVKELHQNNIKVMIKPMLESLDGIWRGQIQFPDAAGIIQGRKTEYWTPWFDSLIQSLEHYGRLAQDLGCEMFCLGCELDGSEKQTKHWHRTIDAVRKVYHGPLSYDTTLWALKGHHCDWFSRLDNVQVSFYPGILDPKQHQQEGLVLVKEMYEDPGYRVPEMIEFLHPWVEEMQRLSERVGKRLIFGECGCRSRAGASAHGSDWQFAGKYEGHEQAKYFDAILGAFWDQPWWGGIFQWKWDEQQYRPHYHDDPAGDKGFTVDGKPAAETLKKWFTRTDRR